MRRAKTGLLPVEEQDTNLRCLAHGKTHPTLRITGASYLDTWKIGENHSQVRSFMPRIFEHGKLCMAWPSSKKKRGQTETEELAMVSVICAYLIVDKEIRGTKKGVTTV